MTTHEQKQVNQLTEASEIIRKVALSRGDLDRDPLAGELCDIVQMVRRIVSELEEGVYND